MNFTPAETAACRHLVELALQEDLGEAGDITSHAIIPFAEKGRAVFVAREAGTLAGIEAVCLVMKAIDSGLIFEPLIVDGADLKAGTRIATVDGPMVSILAGERTALNFLQHLSGIATQTRRYVDAVAGLPCQILDTRKTTPGWRLLEKYAVRCGGGHNHRMGLYDGILIKDNHLAALDDDRSFAAVRAVLTARDKFTNSVPVELEVETLDQFDLALACPSPPDIILLDNMGPDLLRECVWRRNAVERSVARVVLLEASGGVTLATVRAIAETGVDRISVGALTHSAPALDIALDYLHE